MKKFTQLSEPIKCFMSPKWCVPAQKIRHHYLTHDNTVEKSVISMATSEFQFETEQEAILAAREYYTTHGFVYPFTSTEEVVELLDTQSQMMEFI